MGWSRDLGIVGTKDVAARVAEATARARGQLSEADKTKLELLRGAGKAGIALAPGALADLKELEGVREPTLTPEELSTIDLAAEAAAHLVESMGGEAHVHLGASDRKDDQPESSLKGMRQRSITITVTRLEGAPDAPAKAAASPAKVVDNSLPFASK